MKNCHCSQSILCFGTIKLQRTSTLRTTQDRVLGITRWIDTHWCLKVTDVHLGQICWLRLLKVHRSCYTLTVFLLLLFALIYKSYDTKYFMCLYWRLQYGLNYFYLLVAAQHCIQRGLSCERNVCPSVRLYHKRVNSDKTKETYAHILMYRFLVLGHEEQLEGNAPFYLKFWAKLTHSQGCGLALDVSRKIVNVSVSSRSLKADVSVSAIYVSCPRPIFADGAVRSVNGL